MPARKAYPESAREWKRKNRETLLKKSRDYYRKNAKSIADRYRKNAAKSIADKYHREKNLKHVVADKVRNSDGHWIKVRGPRLFRVYIRFVLTENG